MSSIHKFLLQQVYEMHSEQKTEKIEAVPQSNLSIIIHFSEGVVFRKQTGSRKVVSLVKTKMAEI